ALPPELVFIYAMRPDLQQSYDIGTGSGASAFLLWWLSFGAADFADLSELVDRAIMRDLHWAQMPALASAGQRSLTPLMAAIRHERSDLRSAFDVSSADGMAAFWRWWMAEAVRDYPGITTGAADTLRHLAGSTAAAAFRLPSGEALPPELVFIYAMRPDLQQSYDIGT